MFALRKYLNIHQCGKGCLVLYAVINTELELILHDNNFAIAYTVLTLMWYKSYHTKISSYMYVY